jgi:hypothetical protein
MVLGESISSSKPMCTEQVLSAGFDLLSLNELLTDCVSGINFPCYAFENQAETEGFAKMAKRAGYQVIGLPNYVVWHVDTEEKPGNLENRRAY